MNDLIDLDQELRQEILLGWPIKEMHSLEFLSQGLSVLTDILRRDSLSDAIRMKPNGHLLTLAPTGSGKGVASIIPNLLHCERSIVVVDPKGENYMVTAEHRKRLGQEVVLLDPFGLIASMSDEGISSCSLNPLDLLQVNSSSFEDDAQMIAELLMAERSVKSDPFWDASAKGVLTAIIHYVGTSADYAGKRNFRSVVDLLFRDDFDYDMAILMDGEKFDEFARRHMSSYLTAPSNQTRPSIIATARSHCSALTSSSVLNSLENSSIPLEQIKEGRNFTIYIVLPPAKLASHRALLRLWIGMILLVVVSRTSAPKQNTLMLIDECAQLGELQLLVQAVTLLRGYGLQVWMYFQDLSQLESIYPRDWEAIVNNCAVLQTFGHSREAAAAPIADILGGITPNEIATMPARLQVISKAGQRPIRSQLMRYFRDTAFKGKYEPNPYFPLKTSDF